MSPARTTSRPRATSSITNTPSSGRPRRGARERSWFWWTDTYAIDIDDGEDEVLILASAVVIDLVSHPDEKKE